MEDKLAIINRIAEILGSSGEKITVEYTRLVVASAAVWLAVWTVVAMLAWSFDIPAPDWKFGFNQNDADEFAFFAAWAGRVAALIAEAITIGSNLPVLIAPKAEAIDKLISSLSGAE